ncbi:hypothetical protein SHIRM173S_09833 [Streptomyces hirsutus]
MFSRGKATSGAPICSGMIQLAKPANSGVANIRSMIVPCIVNAWLNCSLDTICRPGRASSARITSAITPPTMKNTKDVVRYSEPITLWSVVVSHATTFLPRFRRPGGCNAGVTMVPVLPVVVTATS